jgi:hypothetical protein
LSLNDLKKDIKRNTSNPKSFYPFPDTLFLLYALLSHYQPPTIVVVMATCALAIPSISLG